MAEARKFKSSNTRAAVEWTVTNVDTERYSVRQPTEAEYKAFDLMLLQMPFGSKGPSLIGVTLQLGPLRKDPLWRIDPGARPEEIWVVYNARKPVRRKHAGVVYVSWEDFQKLVAARPPEDGGLKTKRGRTMVANHQQISIGAAALVELIDRRMAELREFHPNSAEAIAAKKEKLEHLERLKRDILALAAASRGLRTGKVKETDAIKTATTLSEGVQKWWDKDHKQICSKVFDAGVFGSAVAICVMAGAGGPLAVTVAAALAGGKKLTDALKGLKGIIKLSGG